MDIITGLYRCTTKGCPCAGPDRHIQETEAGKTLGASLVCGSCGNPYARSGTLSETVAGQVVSVPPAANVQPVPVEPMPLIGGFVGS